VLLTPKSRFAAQPSRVSASKRPPTLNPYVAGNFSFVYKNCTQLSARPSALPVLNDVLFSHCLFRDTGVLWDLLFCVCANAPDDYVCPICLAGPVAPRITQCGHIFCADCLHLLFLLSPNYLCPICYETLIEAELTRCFLRRLPLSATYRLLKIRRDADLNVCAPSPAPCLLPPSNPASFFTRFAIADPEFVRIVYESELAALDAQAAAYKADGEQQRLAITLALEDAITGDVVRQDDTQFVLRDPAGPPVFFYQEANGQLIFLHELNVEMLCDEFGDLASSPDCIDAKVVNSFTAVVDDRHRAPDVAHLPSGAEIRRVLLDLSGVVSADVCERFTFRVDLKRPARKARRRGGKAVTKRDFQSFRPLPPEPEVAMNDEAQFPELVPGLVPQKRPRGPPLKVKEDYPRLSDALPRRGTSAGAATGWGALGAQAKAKSEAAAAAARPRRREDEFPTLSGRPVVSVERPKKTSPWEAVKFGG
jgi:hypothetical protein